MDKNSGMNSDRLRMRMEELEISQAELGRLIGISQTSIWKLVSGDTANSRHLHKIARELRTTPAYLTGETDDPNEGAVPAPTAKTVAEQIGAVLVPRYELGYSMGGGAFIEHAEEIGQMPFPRDMLKSIMKGSFGDLFVASGSGDSMEPTMKDSDVVLIDTAHKDITQQDKIWAISYGDMGMIKRIRRQPGGSYLVMSDNHTVVPAFDVHDEEMHVIGRVIWIGRWM